MGLFIYSAETVFICERLCTNNVDVVVKGGSRILPPISISVLS